jgi:alanine racemase
MQARSEVHVDLSALDHNLMVMRGMLSPGVRLGAVVKADAYGLGAARIARRMAPAVDMLMVFGMDEAEVVHAAAPTTPILVMMPTHAIEAGSPAHGMLVKGLLHLAAHDAAQVRRIERAAAELGVRVPMHIEVDTGLGRGGCLPEDAKALVSMIVGSERLALTGAFTHYANAGGSEGATDAQRERFDAWMADADLPESCVVHSASTFAAIRDGRFHHQMVRMGLAWTGLPFEGTRDGRHMDTVGTLRPVFSWRSHVMQVRSLPVGATVGYGSRWVARVDSAVGLVPVGYADGYPLLPMDTRTLRPAQAERRVVRVRVGQGADAAWVTVPVIGAVSMDQIAIDLTAVVARLPDGGVHASVEVVSADPAAPNHAARVASMTGQHAYELMCRIPPRVPRLYMAAEEAVRVGSDEVKSSARQAS